MANESIKGKLATNTLWNGAERFSVAGIQLLCTFMLARFLTPTDFGIVGMLIVFTTISQIIVDSGFCQALIREKVVSDTDYSSVFYTNVLLSLIIYVLLFLSSGLIAKFYHLEILKEICKITFLVIPINAIAIVQNAILMRNIQFKRLFIISLISALISCAIAIVLAYYLRNVWALVIQNVALYGIRTLLLWLTTSWYPNSRFSLGSIKKYFRFSKNLLLSGLIGNICNNIYSLLIGHFYTAGDLGFYSQAERVSSFATNSTTNVIQKVSYPILAKINNESGNIREAYRKVIKTTLVFVGGIMALLMCVSLDLYEVLMGSVVWRTSGIYLFLLCINGILHPLYSVNQNVLLVTGNSGAIVKLEIIRRSIMLLILCITVHFNVFIFVCGSAFYAVSLLGINLYYCGKPIQYTVKQQLADILPIYGRQACMVVCSMVAYFLMLNSPLLLRLITTFIVGSLVGFVLFRKNPYFVYVLNESRKLVGKKWA